MSKIRSRVVVVQTHVMDYRLPVYQELHRRCGGSFEVWSGVDAFAAAIGHPASAFPWHRDLKNHFFFGRKALWQSGHVIAALEADICVLEFNPRILSTWVILFVRRLLRLRTVLWGHLFPRAGMSARTTPFRMTMLALAGEANLYTRSEAEVFQQRYPWLKANVSPNAVMWKRECWPAKHMRRRRFIFVARLVAEKKPALLLEGFALAIPLLPADICLDFVGEGPCATTLARRAEQLGLQGRVNFHGALFHTEDLRPLYDEALAACSPGYVGLSATQSFGFGVPVLIAENERHSVEIELCHREFNCRFFPSDSPQALADTLLDFVSQSNQWDYEAISAALRDSYTLDHMCDGFMGMFRAHVSQFAALDAPVHVAIAWLGLPYYAARVVREAMDRHPDWRFTIISSRDVVPYTGIEEMLDSRVLWIDSKKPIRWRELGETYPDIMLITSWSHVAYRALASEAKDQFESSIIVMFDNYLRYTPKQIAGYFYYRLVLRRLFAAVWVPGEYSSRFAQFLGACKKDIYTGLYAADHDIFLPPPANVERSGLIFVGQFVPRKGLHSLAQAVTRRRDSGRTLKVTICGCGPLESELLSAGLTVETFRQPDQLALVYGQASALILPSRIDHWGVVAHEAALCGCLLLVTRQCGCAHELVKHGINGYIMARSSSDEVLKAVEWLENLTPQEVAAGRAESIRLAKAISPSDWVNTLDRLVARYPPRRVAQSQLTR